MRLHTGLQAYLDEDELCWMRDLDEKRVENFENLQDNLARGSDHEGYTGWRFWWVREVE